MKKFVKSCAAALLVSFMCTTAQAAPSCVFMKFTDDTRFTKAESAASLSDMVMEKLVASGKFNFKETKVIDQDMEQLLYEGRTAEFRNAEAAARSDNFDTLFNGAGYSEASAQDIATARLGQVVDPSITSAIGKAHGAEYLIQGTMRGIGTGDWMDTQIQEAINLVKNFSNSLGSALSSTPVGGIVGSMDFSQNVTKFGVQADMKVIKASTGEVVWQKLVTGKKTKKQSNVGFGLLKFKVGSDKIDNEMYNEAMDDAVQQIADSLTEAADKGELFR